MIASPSASTTAATSIAEDDARELLDSDADALAPLLPEGLLALTIGAEIFIIERIFAADERRAIEDSRIMTAATGFDQ